MLQSAGLLTGALPAILSGISAAAVSEWESNTGWRPFLKDSANVTRTYDDPEGMLLDLTAGVLTITSVTVGGTVMTANTDYYAQPVDAVLNGRPYEWLEFATTLASGIPNNIKIVGRFGFSASVPQDVWFAVLMKAAIMATHGLATSATAASGPLTSEQYADVAYQYASASSGSSVAADRLSRWNDSYLATVRRYSRRSVK